MSELDLQHDGCTVTRTDELKALMRLRFAPPEYALFFEVYGSTGFGANRRTDAVAMGLYPSRGLLVHGFEFKVSRNDWLKELKDHGKAEEVFGYCDHWWLVVGDRSIVKPNELPPTWGLIAPRAGQLAISVQAPKLKPESLDRAFIAALARRANEAANTSIEDRVVEATKELSESLRRVEVERDEIRRQSPRDLGRIVQEFEQASGIKLRDGYHGPKDVGRVLRAILKNELPQHRSTTEYALSSLECITKGLRELLTALPKGDSDA